MRIDTTRVMPDEAADLIIAHLQDQAFSRLPDGYSRHCSDRSVPPGTRRAVFARRPSRCIGAIAGMVEAVPEPGSGYRELTVVRRGRSGPE